VVVLLLAFEALVKYHQIQCRPLQSGRRPPPGVIFPQVTRGNADNGLISCLKFFANYGFYRFGCEVRCKPADSVYLASLSCFTLSQDTTSILRAVFLVNLGLPVPLEFIPPFVPLAFSALTLLVLRQEGHLARKKIWGIVEVGTG